MARNVFFDYDSKAHENVNLKFYGNSAHPIYIDIRELLHFIHLSHKQRKVRILEFIFL